MTFEQIIAFAAGMAFWTALPGLGLALVVSRALGAGRLSPGANTRRGFQ